MTIAEYFLAVLLVGNVIVAFSSHTRRLQDVERKLNLVLTHLDIDLTAVVPPSSQVIALAADPQHKIAAIKAYRLQTGAGLKEAAAMINKIAAGANSGGA
jgi:ribosomal protein L7/L12